MTRKITRSKSAVLTALALLSGCVSHPLPAEWQVNAQISLDHSIAAYLEGNARIEAFEFERARSEVARTGRLDLLARIELMRCAGRVASVSVEDAAGAGACPAFELLRLDAAAPERAYADYLSARIAAQDVALLPTRHRAVAGVVIASVPDIAVGTRATAATTALQSIDDPLARLVAAGVLLQYGQANSAVISQAVDTASAQGWRRPLLAWLHIQLRGVEAAGLTPQAEQLRRRISLIETSGGRPQ